MNQISRQILKIAKLIRAFDYFSFANIPNFGNYCSDVFQEELKKICSSNPRCSFINNSELSAGFVSKINFKLIEKDMEGNDFKTITFSFGVLIQSEYGKANVHIQSQCNGQEKDGDFVFDVKVLSSEDSDDECKRVAEKLFYDIYKVISTKF